MKYGGPEPTPFVSVNPLSTEAFESRRWAYLMCVDNGYFCPISALHRDCFSDKVDVFGVRTGRNQDRIAVLCGTYRSLNRWLVGRNVDGCCCTRKTNKQQGYDGECRVASV